MDEELPVLSADLRHATFDTFVSFVFDHPEAQDVDDQWFWQVDLRLNVDPALQMEYLARLCRAPSFLADRFSPRQLDIGFWFMFGAGGQEWFRDLLWNPSVPWPARDAVIESIPDLYFGLFERVEIGESPWMLWDLLAQEYEMEFRGPRTAAARMKQRDAEELAEDARVQDAMLAALERQLLSDAPATQRAALHGLLHLAHPEGPALIQRFLAGPRQLSGSIRGYAQQVMAGIGL